MPQFQQAVYRFSGAGVPGESYNDSPSRVQPLILNSALASYNIFGATMFTLAGAGYAAAGNAGSAIFAGLLVNPKSYALYGGSLTPTLTLPNGVVAEFATMGSYFVSLPAAAAVGDKVIFDNTTGAISTISPSAALPTGKSPGYATVDFYTVAGAGLGIITMTYVPAIPVPAGESAGYTDPDGNPYTDLAGDDYVSAPEDGEEVVKSGRKNKENK